MFYILVLGTARLHSLRKNSGFVSGYRFSDTVSHLKSDAPLGAEAAKSTFSAASSAVPIRTFRNAGFSRAALSMLKRILETRSRNSSDRRAGTETASCLPSRTPAPWSQTRARTGRPASDRVFGCALAWIPRAQLLRPGMAPHFSRSLRPCTPPSTAIHVPMVPCRGRQRLAPKARQSLRFFGDFLGEEVPRNKAARSRVFCFARHTRPPTAQLLDDAAVQADLVDHGSRFLPS